MSPIMIDLREPIQTTDDLPRLQAVLVQQIVGEPFLFARLSYADELVLHFGTPREYTLPRCGKRMEGSHILSVRGSAWLLKSGTSPLAAWNGSFPEDFPEPTGERLRTKSLEGGALVTTDARVVATGLFALAKAGGHGLEVRLSDDSRLVVFPTPAEPDQPGDTDLPELADWELLSPGGLLKVGPGHKWEYSPLPRDKSQGGWLPEPLDRLGLIGGVTETGDRITETDSQFAEDTANRDKSRKLYGMVIPENIQAPLPSGYGSSPLSILETCGGANDIHTIEFANQKATIYTKFYPQFAQVVGVEDLGDPYSRVIFAFSIPPDLCDTPLSELSGLEIVERFAEKFGFPIVIGEERRKFFLKREIALPKPVQFLPQPPTVFHIECGIDEAPHLKGFFFSINNAIPSITISFLFCIDALAKNP
jgi:hypothetical protein